MPVYLSGQTASPEREPEKVKGDHLRMEAVLAARGIARQDLANGDSVSLGSGVSLDVLWPPPGRVLQGNDSFVLRLTWNGECLALMTGDLEPAAQRAMLQMHEGRDISARNLVVPHHGSRRNAEPLLYERVRPEAALISAGAWRPMVFPDPGLLATLREMRIPVYATSEHGGLRVRFSKSETQIRVTP